MEVNTDYLALTPSHSSVSIGSLLRRIVRSLSIGEQRFLRHHKTLFDGCFAVFMRIAKVAFWFVWMH